VALHNNGTLLRPCYRYDGPQNKTCRPLFDPIPNEFIRILFLQVIKRDLPVLAMMLLTSRGRWPFQKICGYELKVHTVEEDKVAIFALRKAFLLLLLLYKSPPRWPSINSVRHCTRLLETHP
jgi:hypothetical protein